MDNKSADSIKDQGCRLTRVVRWVLLAVLWLLSCPRKHFRGDESLSYLYRLLYCHVYFRFWRRSIFPAYNFSSKDPIKKAIFAPEVEYTIEHPVTQKQLEDEGAQELLLAAMRSSGEFLFIRLVRASQRQAQIHVMLKEHKGRLFTNVQDASGHLPLDISQGSKYQAGGLRMLCIEPMRKWRIAFNGMMLNNDTGEPAYVRFTFIWTVHTDVFDWHNMIPAHQLVEHCLDSNQKLSQMVSNIETCQEYLNGFEQTGYLVGTLQISEPSTAQLTPSGEQQADEEPEQEWHLRGNFTRVRHPPDNAMAGPADGASPLREFTHSFVYSTKGQMLQLSGLRFLKNDKPLLFGSFVGTSAFKDAIESVLNECDREVDISEAFTSPVLKVNTYELSHDLLRSEAKVVGSFKSVLGYSGELRISSFDAIIDESKAFGFSVQGIIAGDRDDGLIKPPLNVLDFEHSLWVTPHVLSLEDSRCKDGKLTGGKGSSLAVLMELSTTRTWIKQQDNVNFTVPKGVVVTTEAFARFMQSPTMAAVKGDLNKVLSTSSVEEVKAITDICQQRVTAEPIPSFIAKEILTQLQDLFPDLASTRFAVRSSCAGEDSEDMSAAGQMDTFLGVKGENEILAAVAKCWASQFSHVAVGYKRRYGQELVSDMAVVIMEMVAADCAGVMFTCDPLTGDPSTIYITSNFGLGESVVSALADPDTIRVSRGIDGVLTVNEVALGKKDVKIVMNPDGNGTREERIEPSVGETAKSSISSEQSMRLARVGSAIERCYGDWRDIEWAFAGDTLFALQARPVTSIDRPSDFEVSSEYDSAARAENSCYSKANVGEVLNGALTPMGLYVLSRICMTAMILEKSGSARARRFAFSPYSCTLLRISKQHFFMDLSEMFRQFIPEPGDIKAIESMMLNVCGRILDDPEFYEEMGDGSDLPMTVPFFEKHQEILTAKWFARPKTQIARWLLSRYARFPNPTMTIDELFNGLVDSIILIVDYCVLPHLAGSNGSSMWTSDIVNFLSDHTDESMETIYGDMSRLLSSANDVVSADAPKALERLVGVIVGEVGKETFVSASTAQAFEMLKDEATFPKSHEAFTKFLDEHGHRGFNEFDLYQRTWGINPEPVVGTLQTMMRSNLHEANAFKAHQSVWAGVNSIHGKLTFWQKLRLSFIVQRARVAIGSRENSKSLWIRGQHICRQWSWALASAMHKEGRLPEVELLFFCDLGEINKLLRVRDPAIIGRAYQRKRMYPDLVKLQFPEYVRGFARPIVEEPPTFEDGVVKIKGFPISKGRIQAKARVITTIEEAATIQRGEILITYATDIGWSPYFPLLSGIATELGGLMSHGAVVAREYGLPCVVGVFGARQAFRTGDTVLLDGANGFLLKVEEASADSA